MHTCWHINVKKFVWICVKRLRSRAMPRNTSEKANMLIYRLTRGQLFPLDAQRRVKSYSAIVNNIQPRPKRCLLMLLARVGARTDGTTRAATKREAWPISAHAHWHHYVQYARRFCTLVLFISSSMLDQMYRFIHKGLSTDLVSELQQDIGNITRSVTFNCFMLFLKGSSVTCSGGFCFCQKFASWPRRYCRFTC